MHARTRKFRSSAESSQPRIEHPPEPVKRRIERPLTRLFRARRRRRVLLQLLHHIRAGFLDAHPILAPSPRQLLQNRPKSGPSIAIVRWKISAAEKRFPLRSQPYRHRPSPAARRRLHEQHVHAVHVGPLLAIHFYGHEILVQHPRSRLILKRFMLHHMTPVASGIPDRQKNRLVLARRLFERLIAPGIPIHRIMGVLQQVRTLLVSQPIHFFVLV